MVNEIKDIRKQEDIERLECGDWVNFDITEHLHPYKSRAVLPVQYYSGRNRGIYKVFQGRVPKGIMPGNLVFRLKVPYENLKPSKSGSIGLSELGREEFALASERKHPRLYRDIISSLEAQT